MGTRVEGCRGQMRFASTELLQTDGGSRPSSRRSDGRAGPLCLAFGSAFVSSVGPIWLSTQI